MNLNRSKYWSFTISNRGFASQDTSILCNPFIKRAFYKSSCTHNETEGWIELFNPQLSNFVHAIGDDNFHWEIEDHYSDEKDVKGETINVPISEEEAVRELLNMKIPLSRIGYMVSYKGLKYAVLLYKLDR